MRADAIADLRFEHPELSAVGIEAMTLDGLRARAGPALLASPQRVDFHHLLLVESGELRHMVDFADCRVRAGQVLLVRAGQVQQWRLGPRVRGRLALVAPLALAPAAGGDAPELRLLALDDWPAVTTPGRALFAQALADLARLQAEAASFAGGGLDAAILRHQLLALLLRLARDRRADGTAERGRAAQVHALFAQELERCYDRRPSLGALARRLGFSESTLARACLAAAGRTPKQVIDGRIALEAQRLLVHSGATVAEVAHRLGFSEPTNFVKFFRRQAGATPQAFRARFAR